MTEYPIGKGAVLLKARCNIYGAETGGAMALGNLSSSPVTTQWFCPNESVARFRMECAHGHRGQVMPLCGDHARQYSTGKVQFCPRCNTDSRTGHRCPLSLTTIS